MPDKMSPLVYVVIVIDYEGHPENRLPPETLKTWVAAVQNQTASVACMPTMCEVA